jgi:hypothetical protein
MLSEVILRDSDHERWGSGFVNGGKPSVWLARVGSLDVTGISTLFVSSVANGTYQSVQLGIGCHIGALTEYGL